MDKPFVSINMAMTMDGKSVLPEGNWKGLTSENDKMEMDRLRSEVDVLIAGKNSINRDNPYLNLRFIQNGRDPKVAVLLQSGLVSKDTRLFQNCKSRPYLFCTDVNFELLQKDFASIADIVRIGSSKISPSEVLAYLYKQGHRKVLLEGGPKLNHSFLQLDLVDEIHLTIVPFIIGKSDLSSFTASDSPLTGYNQKKWNLNKTIQKDNEIFLIYKRK